MRCWLMFFLIKLLILNQIIIKFTIMKEIITNKYSQESLEFINRLSEKLLEESITSIKDITNKSYIIISVYFSIQIFCLKEIIQVNQAYNDIYLIILLSYFITIVFIFKNIFPTEIQRIGSKGSLMIDEYYEDSIINQLNKYYSSRIEDLDNSINLNFKQINLRVQRVKWSIFSAIVIVLVISCFWFLFTKGLI